MTRPWRIEYKGALYHVLSRGIEWRNIVTGDNDRSAFLEIVGRMCERYGIEMYGHVFMDNHYHLILHRKII